MGCALRQMPPSICSALLGPDVRCLLLPLPEILLGTTARSRDIRLLQPTVLPFGDRS